MKIKDSLHNLHKVNFVDFESSLFFNTSARHERHERHDCDTIETGATRVLHERHECDTSATRTTQVWHEWKILVLITTQVKTYFHTSILAIWWKITRRGTISEMPHSHAEMRLKSPSQKLSFVMGKAISKGYTLDCSCNFLARSRTVTHSNIASFSMKTTLYKTNNILFSKNYWKLGKMKACFWKNI